MKNDAVAIGFMLLCLVCIGAVYKHVAGVGIKYVDPTDNVCGCLVDSYAPDMDQCSRNDRWEVIYVEKCL